MLKRCPTNGRRYHVLHLPRSRQPSQGQHLLLPLSPGLWSLKTTLVRRLQLILLQVLSPLESPSLQRRWETSKPWDASCSDSAGSWVSHSGGHPEVMHTPLFTEEQLGEMIMFQSRASWLYGDRPSRSFFPALRRPPFPQREKRLE